MFFYNQRRDQKVHISKTYKFGGFRVEDDLTVSPFGYSYATPIYGGVETVSLMNVSLAHANTAVFDQGDFSVVWWSNNYIGRQTIVDRVATKTSGYSSNAVTVTNDVRIGHSTYTGVSQEGYSSNWGHGVSLTDSTIRSSEQLQNGNISFASGGNTHTVRLSTYDTNQHYADGVDLYQSTGDTFTSTTGFDSAVEVEGPSTYAKWTSTQGWSFDHLTISSIGFNGSSFGTLEDVSLSGSGSHTVSRTNFGFGAPLVYINDQGTTLFKMETFNSGSQDGEWWQDSTTITLQSEMITGSWTHSLDHGWNSYRGLTATFDHTYRYGDANGWTETSDTTQVLVWDEWGASFTNGLRSWYRNDGAWELTRASSQVVDANGDTVDKWSDSSFATVTPDALYLPELAFVGPGMANLTAAIGEFAHSKGALGAELRNVAKQEAKWSPVSQRELTGDINNALAAFSPYKMYGATDSLLATTEKTFYDSFLKG